MNTSDFIKKTVSVSDFKTHCTEYLREVESGAAEYVITKHGKIIAIVTAPLPEEKKMTAASLLGSLRGTATSSPDYDPHAPAFEDDDWEMNKD